MDEVVITGIGIICSIGQNVTLFTQSIQEGKSGVSYLSEGEDRPFATLGAKIQNFHFEEELGQYNALPKGILKKAKGCARRSPLSVQTSVLSSLEAWQSAQLSEKPKTSDSINLLVTGQNISQNYNYRLNQKFQETPEYLTPNYALHFMDTDHVGTISEVLGINGEGMTVGGASASGNLGLIQAYRMVKFGLCEACLVVGALSDLSPVELQAFSSIGAMGGSKFHDQPEKASRPFDQQADGFIYGQGSGCIIVESEVSAKKRQAPVLAKITGGGICLDGNRRSNPNKNGEIKAMQKAMEEANIAPDKVDYINAHGTASTLGDETEIAAIKTVFEETLSDVWINSTKSMTGHCLFAAGVIEAMATIIQMNENFVHPNLNLDQPIDQQCRFAGKQSTRTKITTALNNSFGFGGFNTSIVLTSKE